VGCSLASGPGRVWVVARGELAGFDNSIFCTLRAVRHLAPAGCGAAAREELAGCNNSIIYTLRAAVWHPAPAGCGAALRGELAGFDNTIICTLWAAVQHPAPAGCGARRAGSSLASTTPSSALCRLPSGIRPRLGVGRRLWLRACDNSIIWPLITAWIPKWQQANKGSPLCCTSSGWQPV
jgi:hypothetical protein